MRVLCETLTDSVFPAPLGCPGRQLDVHPKSSHIPFTGNDNCLTNALFPHSGIRILGDSKQVRLKVSSPSSTVSLDDLRAILGDTLKRVHGDQNNATISVDTMLCIAVPNGMKDYAQILKTVRVIYMEEAHLRAH
jgi:hypothetical protein